MNEQEILESLYNRALELYEGGGQAPALPPPYDVYCRTIIDRQESNRGVLAVLITLSTRKLSTPEQDIRQHQAQLPGGFSGRGLDERVITPFLRDKRFPYMQGGTGWLTRSLEQTNSYDLNYPGNISPSRVKGAFLNLVDGVQNHSLPAENVLLNIFLGLIQFRDRNINLVLARPVNLSVAQVVDRVSRHHSVQTTGAARLPVLAVHAILSILARETDRYRNCKVLPLEQHTAADTRTNLIGDIHIADANGALFEGYEIKHNIPITSGLIQTSFEKLQTAPIERFYILTTYPHEDYSEFEPDIRQIAQAHGCQLTVNGVDCTLLYYLRLIQNTREFIDAYVTNLETDPSVTFQLKELWNEIVAS